MAAPLIPIKTDDLKKFSSLNPIHFLSLDLNRLSPPTRATTGDCVFVSDEASLAQVLKSKPACIIVPDKLIETARTATTDVCLFSARHFPSAMVDVFNLFDQHPKRPPGFIHPSATVHPTAKVSTTAYIGPYTVIDAFAEIADHVVIESHVFVASFSQIGARTILHPYCSIGTPGFGYAQIKDSSGTIVHKRIAQIGKVIIEEDCEFGSFCAIDRAALTETRIGRGTKLDNFCHIAHNCKVGENSILAAGFIMAGSSSIGRNTMAGGGVHITDHVHVADHVVLAGRTGVTANLEKSGMYGGFPATDFKSSLRALSSVAHLPKIRKQISFIFKHLGLDPKED